MKQNVGRKNRSGVIDLKMGGLIKTGTMTF